MAELKPCPFCGGTATAQKNSNTWWRIKCDNCPCEIGRYWYHKKADAIEAWNRRADNATD